MLMTPTERYAAAAREHGDCARRGDSDAGNEAYRQIMAALGELRDSADHGEQALLELIDHSDEWVRVWASTHLLPICEEPARAVLERAANGPSSLVEFNAKMVLQEWQAGRLRLS